MSGDTYGVCVHHKDGGWSNAINNHLVVNSIYTQLTDSLQYWREHTLI